MHLTNLHNLEVDRIKADFTKEIKQLKQQHQYELVEIRKEINEKPKLTKISSEETTLRSLLNEQLAKLHMYVVKRAARLIET